MATKEKSFEEKLEELELIVRELENGEVDLDDAINKYTEAMKIAKECSVKLDSATKAVNKILKENGELEEFKGLEEE
ncbi:MAG: exodeoxyribonuclease VII small subunit [Bacilli bacterium]|mgnify:CR=1 FL=1|jgi:exodeoxyribonuclease VII small subunit|nr:exodeoxyribonuclease VII small subunit [Bacilli bacterium]